MEERTCTLGDCGKRLYAKGLCGMHYQRARQASAVAECNIETCLKPIYSLKYGTCRTHYNSAHARQVRANPDRIAQHREASTRYLSHPENRLRGAERNRRRRRDHPEKSAANRRAWREANPDRNRELARQNQALRKARKLATQTEPVDYAAILAKHGMVCHICTLPIASRTDLHFDHVVPLAKGGPHTEANIRPAHATCNLRKGSRTSI